MAVNSREQRKTAYRNNVYMHGNTAVEWQRAVPAPYAVPTHRVSARTQKNRDRALYMNIGYVLFLLGALVTAGLILTFYITLQSDITNSIKSISRLESQLNDIKLANDENYSRITSDINLDEVRRVAIQELGMHYAEEGQIITFNGDSSDYMRQTGEAPD